MYYQKLIDEIKKISELKVPITSHDRYKFADVFEQNPASFQKNVTYQFFKCMQEHIRQGKVWKINCSGTVRHGKSEVAQTWTMIYVDQFNQALQDGCFDGLEKQGVYYKKKDLVKLSPKQILFSQGNYLYELREKEKDETLIYGEPRIIDEDQVSTGGTGSFTEKLELENINNITAQALQSEWQLRPDKFVLKNSPFGLYQEKMDRENKINWSMLYEFKTDPTRTKDFVFIGWVGTPLHFDDNFRVEYNKMKKENISKVFKGTADLRLMERMKVAEMLSKDTLFSMRSTNGKTFKLGKQQQESILNEWILSQKVQNFNSIEKMEIIEHARMIGEKEYFKKMGLLDTK